MCGDAGGSLVSALHHWTTSRDLSFVGVPVGDAGTGLEGHALGTCVGGGAFVFDPFDAYRAGLVTNPNVVVAGVIGVGKSTFVKMLVRRALHQGRRAVIVDPKGEYRELAHAMGGVVVTVAPHRESWCSPFSGDPNNDVTLLSTLLGSLRQRALGDDELYVLTSAWSRDAATAPRPLFALFEELRDALSDDAPSPRQSLAFGLRRLVEGDLAGVFDGSGEPVDVDAPLVVLDVSTLWSHPAFPAIAVGAAAVARRLVDDPSRPGYLVLDEAWALLAAESVARWLQGSLKLARARGVAHVLVLHRWSDVMAAAHGGPTHRALNATLLRDCETLVLLRHLPGDLDALDAVVALHPREARAVVELPRGAALVRYGEGRSLVIFEPDAHDAEVIDTNAAMLVSS